MAGVTYRRGQSEASGFVRWAVTMVMVGSLFLAACGDTGGAAEVDPPADSTGAEAPTDGATDVAGDPDSPCPDRDVEAVLAELAELPYEERVDVMAERAAEEGAVLLYSSSNLELQELRAEDFTELYPDIEFSYIRVSSEDLPLRLEQEARAGRFFADVIDINALNGFPAWEAGLVADHHGAVVPEGFPEKYVGPWYVTRTITPLVVAYNTDLVSPEEVPETLDDLLDPKWAGKVAIDASADAFVAGLVHSRGQDGAREYLQKLMGDNQALVRDGHTQIVQLLAAGEFPIAIEVFAHRVAEYQNDGEPVDFVVVDPTAANASSPSITKCANNPYAAALLMNYILSERGSQLVADTNLITLHPDVELLHPQLQPFLEPGEEYFERTLVLNPELAAELNGPAFELIAEVIGAHQ